MGKGIPAHFPCPSCYSCHVTFTSHTLYASLAENVFSLDTTDENCSMQLILGV